MGAEDATTMATMRQVYARESVVAFMYSRFRADVS